LFFRADTSYQNGRALRSFSEVGLSSINPLFLVGFWIDDSVAEGERIANEKLD